MKSITRGLSASFAGALVCASAACGTPGEWTGGRIDERQDARQSQGRSGPRPQAGEMDNEPLATRAEATGLRWMREEEKLARDVYLDSLDRYGLRIFANISASEQRHMDAVQALIQARGLNDPAAEMARGEFQDATLAALFTRLNAKSGESEISALEVGAEIEEIDIQDLTTQMALTTDVEILKVYENLARGSRNHLRAFVRNLDRRGARYSPRHLDAETYAGIIAHNQERGHRAGRGRH